MSRKFFRDSSGKIAIFIILGVVLLGAATMTGGLFPREKSSYAPGPQDVVNMSLNTVTSKEKTLQLIAIGGKAVKIPTPTPRPVINDPEPTIPPAPQITPLPCDNTLAVDFLLDKTGSMLTDTPSGVTKIDRLKEAVISLFGTLTDSSVIGVQTFNSTSINNDIPVSYYRDVKSTAANTINKIVARGGTPTSNALSFSYQKLVEAQAKFPGKKFNFVFISDGEPNAGQDPTQHNPNPATQIKNLGINVFAVGVFDSNQATNVKFANLLKSIASKSENYYPVDNADELKNVLLSLAETSCQ